MRRAAGTALVVVGALGVLLSAALLAYGLVAVPEMSGDKKRSESLITVLVAAWCAGFIVAGRILRRP